MYGENNKQHNYMKLEYVCVSSTFLFKFFMAWGLNEISCCGNSVAEIQYQKSYSEELFSKALLSKPEKIRSALPNGVRCVSALKHYVVRKLSCDGSVFPVKYFPYSVYTISKNCEY